MKKGIVHRVSDGTNHPKYALGYGGSQQNNHAYFHCTTCEKTIYRGSMHSIVITCPTWHLREQNDEPVRMQFNLLA